MRIAVTVLGLLLPAIAGADTGEEIAFSDCGGMICVPMTLADGHSHSLLLDTGNVNSWLTGDAPRRLGLTLDPITNDGKPLPGVFRAGAQSVSLGTAPLSAKFLAL